VLISHSKRFIFLANPKTGSMSVQKILRPHSDVKSPPETLPLEERVASGLHNHITARDLMATFAQRGWAWGDYHSFTMIRNPWDRIVSAYEYARGNPDSIHHARANAAGSFARYVEGDPIRPVDWHAFDDTGRQLVTEIIRVEDIAGRLPATLRRIGIDCASIPHMNQSSRRPYREYYDETLREIVRQKYALDIAVGGYEF
jgi:hypothetical protein